MAKLKPVYIPPSNPSGSQWNHQLLIDPDLRQQYADIF